MWEVMISVRWALWRVLLELLSVLQDCRLRKVFSSAADDSCFYPLALLVCSEIDDKEFADLYKAQRYLRHPSPVMLSLTLTGLVTLSKTPKMARKMPVLLPDIMETLTAANTNVRVKALLIFNNVICHMKWEEASLIALRLVEKLPPLFDDESSQVRELSIRLFKELVKTMVGRNTRKMVKKAPSVLLPLFFHMNDQNESVAKASRDTFCAFADLLRWVRLSSMAMAGQTHLLGECLIAYNRSRVEKYLNHSLLYLENPQATVREAAVRFISLAAQHVRNLSQERLWEICYGE
ncbi:unnamed protein product [Bubo scandiacus]